MATVPAVVAGPVAPAAYERRAARADARTGWRQLRSMIGEQLELARTLRRLRIRHEPDRCSGCLTCYDVCPIGCWSPAGASGKSTLVTPGLCVACGACVLQCPENAIALTTSELRPTAGLGGRQHEEGT
ncbi:MAG: ferredoxin family protein [Anaerolineae bacterium]